jgi:hypothetical protein
MDIPPTKVTFDDAYPLWTTGGDGTRARGRRTINKNDREKKRRRSRRRTQRPPRAASMRWPRRRM